MLLTANKSLIVSILALLFLSSCELSLAQDLTPPPNYQRVSIEQPSNEAIFTLPETSPNINSGKAIFAESCEPCHGELGIGGGSQEDKLPKLPPQIGSVEVAENSSPVDWFAAITLGNIEALMPPFEEDLSVQERWDVMTYVYSLSDSLEMVESVMPDGIEISFEEAVPEAEPTITGEDSATEEITDSTPEATEKNEDISTGTVRGTISHGAGEAIPADLEVTLLAFDGFEPAFDMSTIALGDGSFVFENIELAEQRIFFTTVTYGGASYSSRFDIMQEAANELEFAVTIYDSTTDKSNLSITWLAVRFEFTMEDSVRVHVFYQVTNPSQETVVSASMEDPIMNYSLPDNATNFSFEEEFAGENFVITDDGFGDTSPIAAESDDYTLAFAYDLPYDRELLLTQNIDLPVNELFVFLPVDGPNLNTEAFTQTGETVIGEVDYLAFNLKEVEVGLIDIEVEGRNPAGPAGFLGLDVEVNLIVSAAVFIVAILAVGLFVVQNREKVSGSEELSSVDLIDAIIALDEKHEAGYITQAVYQSKREALKSQLKELL